MAAGGGIREFPSLATSDGGFLQIGAEVLPGFQGHRQFRHIIAFPDDIIPFVEDLARLGHPGIGFPYGPGRVENRVVGIESQPLIQHINVEVFQFRFQILIINLDFPIHFITLI